MRVVVDTSVVISAILRDCRPENVLLFIVWRSPPLTANHKC
jgi:predicted nucleic acid-binding protein